MLKISRTSHRVELRWLRTIAMVSILFIGLTVSQLSKVNAWSLYDNNYPEPWRSGSLGQYVDSWGYSSRYCTSWVAWALHDRNGFEMPRAIGDASAWGGWAINNGYRVDMVPAVGSVAWWSSNHVAWVSAINGDTVTIEEYNYGYTGNYNKRSISKDSVSRYIHFKDVATWGGVQGLLFKGSDTLQAGQRLNGGEYLLSSDGRYVLVMQQDGNLVIYSGTSQLWNSGTENHPGAFAQMQGDGNFVIYGPDNIPLWNTGIKNIAHLVIQGDGNFVGYTSSDQAAWSTGTVSSENIQYVGTDRLQQGQRLYGGQFIQSSDKKYAALMQKDGNFVVYAPGYKVLWSSSTNSNPGAYVQMQIDGNFVVYNSSNIPLWQTNTSNTSGSNLMIQNDGNLVLYIASGSALWSTGTSGRLS